MAASVGLQRLMRLALFLLLALVPLLLITPALAQEPARPALRLRYQEPEGPAVCSGEALLREEIRTRMGYEPLQEDAEDEAVVTVAVRGDHLVARVDYRNAAGEVFSQRAFEVPNVACGCFRLLFYVASSIEFTLTPVEIREREPAPAPVCPEPPPRRTVSPALRDAPPPPRPPPPSSPAAPADPALKPFQLGVGALGGAGIAEEAFAGGYALFRLRWPDLSVALEGRILRIASRERAATAVIERSNTDSSMPPPPPQLIIAEWQRTRGVLAVALVPCAHGRRLFACGVLEAGSLSLSERSPDAPRTAHKSMPGHMHLDAGLRAGVELPVGPALSFHVFTELLSTFMPLEAEPTDVGALLSSQLTATLGAGVLLAL